MQQIHYTILQNCSGKSYTKLVENFGKANVDYLLTANLIVKLNNDIITRTEEGLTVSKPLEVKENIRTTDYNLLIDSANNTEDSLLLDSKAVKFKRNNRLNS